MGYEIIKSLTVTPPSHIPKGVSFIAFRFSGFEANDRVSEEKRLSHYLAGPQIQMLQIRE